MGGGRRGRGRGIESCQIWEGVSGDGHHGRQPLEGARESSGWGEGVDLPIVKCFLVTQERITQAIHILGSL